MQLVPQNSTTSTAALQADETTTQENKVSTPLDEPLYLDLLEFDPGTMPRKLFEALMLQSLEYNESTRSRQGGKCA